MIFNFEKFHIDNMRIKKSFLISADGSNKIREIIVESGILIYKFDHHRHILFGKLTTGSDRETGFIYYERIFTKSVNNWELINEPKDEFLKDRGFLTFMDLMGYYNI